MIDFRQKNAVTRNVLSSILVLDMIVATSLMMSLFSSHTFMPVYLLILFSICVVLTFAAFSYFAIRKPELLLTETTQVQALLAQTFGQGIHKGDEKVKIIDAIRRNTDGDTPSSYSQRLLSRPNNFEQDGGGK